MVKVDVTYGDYPVSMADIYDWLEENLSPRTIGAPNAEEALDEGELDHHFCIGGERWQYHFVRTTLMPADEDLYLYQSIFESTAGKPAQMFRMAMYIEFPNDADAVHFKLALGGQQ